MEFEHLVEINDFNYPLLTHLSREQIWEGLIKRAYQPQLFIPAIESCAIAHINAHCIHRTLDFGKYTVLNEMTFVNLHATHYVVQQSTASQLSITIEEPDDKHFFLRFCYQTHLEHMDTPVEQAQAESFLKQAYRASDIDTVQIIRQLAQTNH